MYRKSIHDENTTEINRISALTPTTGNERIAEIDLLRGFALFGIIMVNVQYFGLPFYKVLSELYPFTDSASTIGRGMVGIFFEGKFITLFSFLFGLGFWLFVKRARARGRKAGPVFFRRLLILGVIGAAHAILFWAGDILHIYTIIGLLMLVFLNRSDKTVRVWMVLFPAIQFLLYLIIVIMVQWALSMPEVGEQMMAEFAQVQDEMEQFAVTAMAVYSSSDWLAMLSVRLQELVFVWQGMIMSSIGFFYLWGLFLAGMIAGRTGWFTDIQKKLPVIRKRAPWFVLSGLICVLFGYILGNYGNLLIPDWYMAGHFLFFIVGTPLLTAGYSMLMILAYNRWKSGRLWNLLIPAGRMSLTVYLTQTIILSTIFYGYGLGLHGSVPVVPMLLNALFVFGLQLIAARWWMQRFTMGPFEWIWRAATYGYFPALKK